MTSKKKKRKKHTQTLAQKIISTKAECNGKLNETNSKWVVVCVCVCSVGSMEEQFVMNHITSCRFITGKSHTE